MPVPVLPITLVADCTSPAIRIVAIFFRLTTGEEGVVMQVDWLELAKYGPVVLVVGFFVSYQCRQLKTMERLLDIIDRLVRK